MPRPRRKPRGRHPVPLLATAAVSAAGFAATSTLVAKHKTRWFDGRARRTFPKRRHGVTRVVVRTLGYTGKPYVHGPAAALLAQYITHKGARDGGRAINMASTLATTASKAFDWLLYRRVPPPGRHSVTEPSFPSGHTLETTAVACTAAYVLWREGLVDGRIALPIALAIPTAQGAGRLYLDRHWATDVFGGALAGISVAAICTAGYEARKRR